MPLADRSSPKSRCGATPSAPTPPEHRASCAGAWHARPAGTPPGEKRRARPPPRRRASGPR
eukprot:15121140-Alexandrium_andersonii.AAC.1